ncbi:MAG: geranylgeranyl reductase family protein [Candidatus Heimdallarchaeota archaeon]
MDVITIGAGPAGCKTAELIAEAGYNVLIIEEHSEVGKPVQCTGLVSEKIGKIPDEIIVNKINNARFCCGEEFFEIESKKQVYVIDREKFDKYLAKRAEMAGARFRFRTRFLDFKLDKAITTDGKYETNILVGADGPNSLVAKKAGIKLPENVLFASQVYVKSDFDPDTVELWFGSDIAPGSFAWVVPESNSRARIGLMTDKNPRFYLEKFIRKRCGRAQKSKQTGDMIRYGLIKKSVADNVLLVGDAACQIKPFSAGGLVYGQIAARYAAHACIKAVEENNFSKNFLEGNYDKMWKKELAGPIRKGMLMKKFFSKIQDKPLLFKLIKSLRITKLSSLMDVDFLGKD